MSWVFIGLGSNLSNEQHSSLSILKHAVQQLQTIASQQVMVSSLYLSQPLGPQDQPDYLNAVAQLKTHLLPVELLDTLQQFEQQAGRVRTRRWGARTLDLDILLYEQLNIATDRLIIPHQGLFEREFVLRPLLELDATLCVNGQLLSELAAAKPSPHMQKVADAQWIYLNDKDIVTSRDAI